MDKNIQGEYVELSHGGGGIKSNELIKEMRGFLTMKSPANIRGASKWKNCEDDAAVLDLAPLIKGVRGISENGSNPPRPPYQGGIKSPGTSSSRLVFTTDAFIIDPIFFPGGDIGKIAVCGTINDLSVMGAKPLGISLSMVIEEGFSKADLMKIMKSIGDTAADAGVPVVTGDTKVMEKGKLDKIEITTSGVGLAEKIIPNNGAKVGNVIISSGDLGEHGVALLAYRFNYQTKIKSDCKPLNKELAAVGKYLNACKDPTRGGLAANLNEIAEKSKVRIILNEATLPYKKEARAVSDLLGIDIFSLPSEGRFIASVDKKNSAKVLAILKKFSKEAKIIGEVHQLGTTRSKLEKSGVFLKTNLGALRKIDNPSEKLIPRIC